MLRDALGFHPETPRLDDGFRKRLGDCIGVDVPECAFLAMDYHLDWIQIAFHLDANPDKSQVIPFPSPISVTSTGIRRTSTFWSLSRARTPAGQ